jgi:protein tyrosine phosphatase type 4A
MEFNGTVLEFGLKHGKEGAEPGSTAATLRFLILDAPAPSTLATYIKELQRNQVKHLVRVCTQTYRSDIVQMADIKTHAWPFEDGAPPPSEIVSQWLQLVDSEVEEKGADGKVARIAVHCVAGLGRAPMLVAVALVEYGDFQPLDAVGFIRERRKGAINQVQLNWLMKYTPRWKKKGRFLAPCCPVM